MADMNETIKGSSVVDLASSGTKRNITDGAPDDLSLKVKESGVYHQPDHGTKSTSTFIAGQLRRSQTTDNVLEERSTASPKPLADPKLKPSPLPSVADSHDTDDADPLSGGIEEWVLDSTASDDVTDPVGESNSSEHALFDAKLRVDRAFAKELRMRQKSQRGKLNVHAFNNLVKTAYPEIYEQSKPRSKQMEPTKEVIRLSDFMDRHFIFPYEDCKTWTGMQRLVYIAFRNYETLEPYVKRGEYDLLDLESNTILPSTWKYMVRPGWSLTMRMWPRKELLEHDSKFNEQPFGAVDEGYVRIMDNELQDKNVDTEQYRSADVDTQDDILEDDYPGNVSLYEDMSHSVGSGRKTSKGSIISNANTRDSMNRTISEDTELKNNQFYGSKLETSRVKDKQRKSSMSDRRRSDGNLEKGKQLNDRQLNDINKPSVLANSLPESEQPAHPQSYNVQPSTTQPSTASTSHSDRSENGHPIVQDRLPPSQPYFNQYFPYPATHGYPYYNPYNYPSYPISDNRQQFQPYPAPYENPSDTSQYSFQLHHPQGQPTEPVKPFNGPLSDSNQAERGNYQDLGVISESPLANTSNSERMNHFKPRQASVRFSEPITHESRREQREHDASRRTTSDTRRLPSIISTNSPQILSNLTGARHAEWAESGSTLGIKPRSATTPPRATHQNPKDNIQAKLFDEVYYYSSESETQDSPGGSYCPEQTRAWKEIKPLSKEELNTQQWLIREKYRSKFAQDLPLARRDTSRDFPIAKFSTAFPTLFDEEANKFWNAFKLNHILLLEYLMLSLFSPTQSRYWTRGLRSTKDDYQLSQSASLWNTLQRLKNVNSQIGCKDSFLPTMVMILIHMAMASWRVASWARGKRSGSGLDWPMWKLQNLCYRRRILQQPKAREKNLAQLHRKYIYAVFCSMNYKSNEIDLIRLCDLKWTAEDAKLSVGDVMMKAVDKRMTLQRALPQTTEPLFETSHLSVRALLGIGKIEIEWTLSLDEHLRLKNAANGKRALQIFWDPSLLWIIYGYFDDLPKWPELIELKRTYAILFHPSSTIQTRSKKLPGTTQGLDLEASTDPEATKPFNFPTPLTEIDINDAYFLLPAPPSIAAQQDQSQFSPLTTAKATMKHAPPYTLASHLHHEAVQTTPLNAMEEFASYAVFGDRLRELQWYMDKTKPRGLFGLWRDRRDSLAWYTLWAAIAFGSVSLFLAFSSVVISAVQTRAAFLALEQQQQQQGGR